MDYPRYDPTLKDNPLDDAELQALDALLQAVPADTAMNVEALDGYLTALLIGPRSIDSLHTRDWLPAVWGGDGENAAPFASQRQRKRATVLVLRHLQSIACKLRDAPDEWEPVFSVAETPEGEWVDAEDWCIGFLQAVALQPEAWAAVFDDAELSAALVPVVALGGADAAPVEDEQARDELSRAAIDGVLLLSQRTGHDAVTAPGEPPAPVPPPSGD